MNKLNFSLKTPSGGGFTLLEKKSLTKPEANNSAVADGLKPPTGSTFLTGQARVIIISLFATLACVGIIKAATTIGNNISTGGTITGSGANTLYGATSIGGAITATSTLAVNGTTTLYGSLIGYGDATLSNLTATGTLSVTGLTTLGNASTTMLSVSGNTWLATTTSGTTNIKTGSASAFVVEEADGTDVFNIDTTNESRQFTKSGDGSIFQSFSQMSEIIPNDTAYGSLLDRITITGTTAPELTTMMRMFDTKIDFSSAVNASIEGARFYVFVPDTNSTANTGVNLTGVSILPLHLGSAALGGVTGTNVDLELEQIASGGSVAGAVGFNSIATMDGTNTIINGDLRGFASSFSNTAPATLTGQMQHFKCSSTPAKTNPYTGQPDGWCLHNTDTDANTRLAGTFLNQGTIIDKKTVTTDNTNSGQIISAAEMLGGIYLRGTDNALTGATVDTTDTAANIILAMPTCYDGASFKYVFWNKDSTHTLDIAAGTGITLVPTDPTAVAANSSAEHIVIATDCETTLTGYTFATGGDDVNKTGTSAAGWTNGKIFTPMVTQGGLTRGTSYSVCDAGADAFSVDTVIGCGGDCSTCSSKADLTGFGAATSNFLIQTGVTIYTRGDVAD
jgi:cytoskeletal protein CcmA (bactofilin family)